MRARAPLWSRAQMPARVARDDVRFARRDPLTRRSWLTKGCDAAVPSAEVAVALCWAHSFAVAQPNLNALRRSWPRSKGRVDVARRVRAKASFMDDLLREFLTETSESLDTVDNQLVRFEQDPNNAKILDNIFRLVHTIKGTCGFLGLPRLEALAHAAETLMGKFRDGMPVTAEAVTLILSSIDRIKEILSGLEATEAEPEDTDQHLIVKLEDMVERGIKQMPETVASAEAAQPKVAEGALVPQTLERPLRPGEVS